MTNNSIVYSFGVGEDVTFDLALIKQYGLNIYAFDPTPRAIEFVEKEDLPPQFYFEGVGISDKDEFVNFYLPANEMHVSGSVIDKNEGVEPIEVEMKKISTIMKSLNHSQIDLLKMDIEGSEYAVLDNMLDEGIYPKQLCVEFHHRFPQIGLNQTKEIIQKLNTAGYKIVKISDHGQEYTFLLYRH